MMTAQFEAPELLTALTENSQLLREILIEVRELKRSNYNEWLNASDFCKKYNISRPTLYKRAKQGFIEVCNFGGDINRYKMKEDNNNGK